MYNNNQDLFDDTVYSNTALGDTDFKDAFFMDVKDSIEAQVRNSLFLYLAYEAKGLEAAKYKEDSKADVPFLKREAELRGMKLPALVELVESKGVALKLAISELELLRVEFNLRYVNISDHQERLQLRDELLGRIKTIMSNLD